MGLSQGLSCEAGSFSCCRPNPHRFFHSGLRLYFPVLEPWVAQSARSPPFVLVYLCTNVGPQGLLPAPFVPHSTSPGSTMATRVLSTRAAVSTPPTGLDECLFFISLVSDFLAVRFSVSSGCARRHSVSTYTAILVLRTEFFLLHILFNFSQYCFETH